MCQVDFEKGTRKLKQNAARFFYLEKDPYELKNLAGTGTECGTEEELVGKVKDFDRRVNYMEE